MKQLLAIALLTFGVAAAPARQDAPGKAACALSAADVPGVGVFRLGMTTEQVLALFPGSKEDPEVRAGLSGPPSPLGVSGLIIRPGKYQSKDKFAGISRVTFDLLDGRVSGFSVGYDGPEWPHVDKFVAKVIEGANLPGVEAWESPQGMDHQLKKLTCTDFEIHVYAGGEGGNLNYVLMSDLGAARTLKERRAKAREKLKQESRP